MNGLARGVVNLRLSLAMFAVFSTVALGGAAEARAEADPLGGWWRVASIGTTSLPAELRARATAVFRRPRFSGSDTCNGYWGSYSRTGTTLHLKVEGVTTKSCRWADGAPSVEGKIRALLDRTERFERHGDRLTLVADDGERMELVRAPESDRIIVLRDPDASREARALRDPQFSKRPTREQLLASFDRTGGRADFTSVQVVCAALRLGDLTDCRVPGGSSTGGANAAAIAAAQQFRLTRADAALVRRHRVLVVFDVEFPSNSPEPPARVR